MLTLHEITQRADRDGVDALTVERDYVITHVMCALASRPDSDVMQFKGGTALRLCYFEAYRYSADIDLNVDPALGTAERFRMLEEVMRDCRDRVGFPVLELADDGQLRIEFEGPRRAKRLGRIKLDIADDELIGDSAHTASLLARYPDQTKAPPLRTYSLEEAAAEKLRCILQRLLCRDLYDLWFLFEHAGVEPASIRPLFEAKTRHRYHDPDELPNRLESLEPEYRRRWEGEMGNYLADPPDYERVAREVQRALRQGGYKAE